MICAWLGLLLLLFTQSCLTLCNPMDWTPPGFPVLHHLPEYAQAHVHWIIDTIQLSHPLSSPSSPTFSLSQHQGLFQWVDSASGGQSIGASALVLPMNSQAWFPLGFTCFISLLSLGLGYKWAPESPRSPFLGLLPSAGHSAPGPLSSSVKGDIVTGVVNKTTAYGLAQMEPEANVSCYPAKLMPVPIFSSPHRRTAMRKSNLVAG